MLRSRYLVDVDCWGQVRGEPIKPGAMYKAICDKLREARS